MIKRLLMGIVIFFVCVANDAAEPGKVQLAPGVDEIRLQIRTITPMTKSEMEPSQKDPFPFKGFSWFEGRIAIASHFAKKARVLLLVDRDYCELLRKSEANRELVAAVARTEDAAKKMGISILDVNGPTSAEELLKQSKFRDAAFILFVSGGFESQSGLTDWLPLARRLRQSGVELVAIRDLLPVLPGPASGSPFRRREQETIRYERKGGMTVVSSDLTGEKAFRFPKDNRAKICFLVSDDHYNASRVLPIYGEYLMDGLDLYCVTVTGEGGPSFWHLEELDDADSLLVYFRRLPVPEAMKAKIEEHLGGGKGLVGLRTSSHAMDPRGVVPEGYTTWPEFDHEVQGGHYNGHGPNDLGADVMPPPGQKSHPVIAGIKPECWHSVGSLYYAGPISEDSMIVQVGSVLLKNKKEPDGPLVRRVEPVTWLRYYGDRKARIACSTLGHPDDFSVPEGRELFTRLILWSMDRPLTSK